jgi:hypothetical protein
MRGNKRRIPMKKRHRINLGKLLADQAISRVIKGEPKTPSDHELAKALKAFKGDFPLLTMKAQGNA